MTNQILNPNVQIVIHWSLGIGAWSFDKFWFKNEVFIKIKILFGKVLILWYDIFVHQWSKTVLQKHAKRFVNICFGPWVKRETYHPYIRDMFNSKVNIKKLVQIISRTSFLFSEKFILHLF